MSERRSLAAAAAAATLAASALASLVLAPAGFAAYPYQGPAFPQRPPPFGPDGPPPPTNSAAPLPGRDQARTSPDLSRHQDRMLLYGPFPARSLTRGVSDEFVTLSTDPVLRSLDLGRARAAGAAMVRIPVVWNSIVSAQPPANADLSDPASGAYRFATLDGAVRAAIAAGLTPVLVFVGAPRFAEAQPRWRYAYPGTWDPDPHALGQFATAVARRYGGAFADPLRTDSVLPRVRFLQAWNEPNLPRYLEPQWVISGHLWVPFAPQHYREMLNAFYVGVKSVAPDDIVVNAGLAPVGGPSGLGSMSPIPFLRTLLCFRPRSPRTARCPSPAHFDAIAFHPLSVGDPDRPAVYADDASISDVGKVAALVRAARAARTVMPVGPKPLWVTELNWQTNPPKPGAVPARLQGAWVSRALHRLWVAGARVVDWQFIVDPVLSVATPLGGLVPVDRPAGLFLRGRNGPSSDRPKPLYVAFRFPFDPVRRDGAHLLVWGLLPASGDRRAVLQRWQEGRWRRVATVAVSAAGMINELVALRGAARLRLRSGRESSPVRRVGTRPFA